VTDLGERLASRGARVWHHYDGAIDMAAAVDPLVTLARDDHEVSVPVAVESDGTRRYRELSVRERTRQRPELLERMGWRSFTLWTIEVFTDPGSCADMIAELLGLDGQTEDGSGAGFLSGAVGPVTSSFEAVLSASYPLADGYRQEEAASDLYRHHSLDPESREEATPVAARDHLSSHRRVTAPATGGQEANSSSEEDSQDESAEENRTQEHGHEPPLIPDRAAEDDPRSWGDREPDDERDQWLREQRPPHWG
jgi:hypothetical protein